MAGFRDIKRAARRDLHAHMAVPALYIAAPGDDPVPCTVRLWTSDAPIGALAGSTANQYAERQEMTPKLRLSRSEISEPRRTAVVSVETGEAYRIERVFPADDEFVTVDVTRLSAAEAAGLSVPEGAA